MHNPDDQQIIQAIAFLLTLPARQHLLRGDQRRTRQRSSPSSPDHRSWMGMVTAEEPGLPIAIAEPEPRLRTIRLRNPSMHTATITGFRSGGWTTPWTRSQLLESIGATGLSQRQAAFAVWQYIARSGVRGSPSIGQKHRRDPIPFLCLYGGDCNDFATVYCTIAHACGLEARVAVYDGHGAPEVRIDGRWVILDPNLVTFTRDQRTGLLDGANSITRERLEESRYGYPVATLDNADTPLLSHQWKHYNAIFATRSFSLAPPEEAAWHELSLSLAPGDDLSFHADLDGMAPPFFCNGETLNAPSQASYRLIRRMAKEAGAPLDLTVAVPFPILDAMLEVSAFSDSEWPETFRIGLSASGQEIGSLVIEERHFIGRNHFEVPLGEAVAPGRAREPFMDLQVVLPQFLGPLAVEAKLTVIGSVLAAALPQLCHGDSTIEVLGEFETLELTVEGSERAIDCEPVPAPTLHPPVIRQPGDEPGQDGSVELSWEGDPLFAYEVMLCCDEHFIEPILPQYMRIVDKASLTVPLRHLSGVPDIFWRVRAVTGPYAYGPPASMRLDLPTDLVVAPAPPVPEQQFVCGIREEFRLPD
ncbi:hypothetical protein J2848_006751 [Azospirillum lipoferum]|uniref:Transglutaminase domain-containing protein n=1 Tax=Azospirillum lipoferum TaxID=193 RepID=A0A5A9GH01_AZOLI|nr:MULTISPECIES: transglutaminase-like domain-containing protein [Azospirillum]KAA0593701.1 transglutaminase domain-containing protein [Azospirillum lipoferum]MCP1615038.1 hypothetical protein [Azospirillum lipoferum]MDW5536943.1 transglutaminase-like domain-containing protein [Azospirillum sp. NL1]